MFECTICGLLSLGGSACPACGSQIRVDLAEQDDGSPLPAEVPGLDAAVASWNELEGIDPVDSQEEVAEVEPAKSKSSLPFGFAGASNTNISRLPFGIGSFAAGMPFDDSETALPLVSEHHATTQSKAEHMVQSEPQAQPQPEAQAQPQSEPQAQPQPEPPQHAPEAPIEPSQGHEAASEPAHSQQQPPRAAPHPSASALTPPSSSTPPSPPTLPNPVPSPAIPSEPVRLVPDHASSALPRLEATVVQHEPIALDPQPMRLEATPQNLPQQESVAAFDAGVPDMWKIDAAAPDMEQIYAQSEQVVEVVHTMEVEPTVYAHETTSVAPNSGGGVISLDIHPAQALAVNLAGMPELESTLQQGFQALSASS